MIGRLAMSERLPAIAKQHCPICFRGKVFRGLISMHEFCPQCGSRYEREHGFFIGALYVAYWMSVAALSSLMALFWVLGAGSASRSLLLAAAVYVPISVAVFRYSRVVWMHLWQILDPRGTVTPGELSR
jgi:uncharacterized protein (DUF983 family)